MFKWVRSFIVFVALATIVLSGCSQQSNDLEIENQKLRSEVKQLQLKVEEKNKQIEQYKKEYNLQIMLYYDIRKLLSALDKGVFSEDEKDLLNDNIAVLEDRLVITSENNTHDFLFFENKLDFEWVRLMHFFHLDDEGRFVIGYEVFDKTDNEEEKIASRRIEVFTFIEKPSGWKLVDIGTGV